MTDRLVELAQIREDAVEVERASKGAASMGLPELVILVGRLAADVAAVAYHLESSIRELRRGGSIAGDPDVRG
jgi:hypothetical protein